MQDFERQLRPAPLIGSLSAKTTSHQWEPSRQACHALCGEVEKFSRDTTGALWRWRVYCGKGHWGWGASPSLSSASPPRLLSLRRWSAARWTRCSRSSCLASLPCSSLPSPPARPFPLPRPPPPPPPPFLKPRLLPKKEGSASEDGCCSDRWTETGGRMTGAIRSVTWHDESEHGW